MRNRAKCKLCQNIIESYTILDVVQCKCGEIEIWGGNQELKCAANDWKNFLRVDDEGNEIIVKVKVSDVKPLDNAKKPTKQELLDMLDEMVKSYERLPEQAMSSPISHSDFTSILMLLSALFRAAD